MREFIFDLQRFDRMGNGDSNVVFNGTSGDDQMYNYGSRVTINAGAGNDSIDNAWNYGQGSLTAINGSAGKDSIWNNADRVTIDGGAGNDYVSNVNGTRITIKGGDGDDAIHNRGTEVSIEGGAGNDYINNYYYDEYRTGSNVTMLSGAGNDVIKNTADKVTINAGADNDSIYNDSGHSLTIDGGAGNDTLYNYKGTNVTMNGGDGNDHITNLETTKVTIKSGAGKDYIYNELGSSIAIAAGDDNDTIENYEGNNVTINAGAGNDRISLGAYAQKSLIVYKEGDGNDIIEGIKETDTLQIGGGKGAYSTVKKGSNIIVTVGEGKITLVGAAELSKLNIAGKKSSVTTQAATLLTVNDSTNSPVTVGSSVKIINAASRTKAVQITGNAQNNSIVGGSNNDTLNGGKGNDTLTGKGGNDLFIYSAGKDVITDYTEDDKIKITAGKISKGALSGNDVVFTVGKNTLTVKNAKGNSLSMIDSAGKSFSTVLGGAATPTTLKVDDSTSSPVTVGSAIKTINASTRTTAVQITGNALNNSILGGSGNDTLNGGAGNDSLKGGNGADVFVYSGGNDVITDYAASDKISIASGNVSTVKTSGKNVVFTVGTGNISVVNGKGKTITYVDGSGEHTYSGSSSANVSVNGSTIKLLPSYLDENFDVANYGAAIQKIDATQVLLDINIKGNRLMNSIIGGDGNDTIDGSKGNDTLTGGAGSDIFLYNDGDGNDLITDYKEEDIIQIASGKVDKVKKSGNNVILTVGRGNISVAGGAKTVVTYIDSTGEHTYPETVKFNTNGTSVNILSSYTKDDFNIADYDDYKDTVKNINAALVMHDIAITGNKLANNITGSDQNDYINGESGGDSIFGGDGNDTIEGSTGNDTLTGGNGSDIFLYNAGDGDDLITDYAEEDKIRVDSGKISGISKSGKNVIFTVGSNKITVAGAASKIITYIDADGDVKYYPTTPTDTVILTDSKTKAILRETYSKDTFIASNYGSSIKTIDATAVDHGISITGNGKANQILGGYEDDTINGGKGNDTLQGGSGADTFLYANGDGKDIILDYDEEDTIKITKGAVKVATSGDNVVFTVGSGKMTLNGAADKIVNYIDAGGNKKTYSSSSSNVTESWFVADDNNFELTPNNLSALVQSKAVDYSFANTSTKLSKETNLIAYSGSKK